MNEDSNIKNEIISWIKTLGIVFIVVFIITKGIIVNAYIPTSSMENTIMAGDRIIASRLAYKFDEPVRGDIIVFKYPDDPSVLYVKRIIGMSGDEVYIDDNIVYINGTPLDEAYINVAILGEFGPYTVPENNYFMMGDNRNNSKDSRYWDNTFLEKDDILGKVIFRYFPSLKVYN